MPHTNIKGKKGLHLFKHGYSKSIELKKGVSLTYNSWRGMKERCTNVNHKNYELYKNRLDDSRWLDFINFLEDMGERPSKLHQLDRKDNSKGYCKDNCRWSSIYEQHRNHSRNVMVNFHGTYCMKDLADALEVDYNILRYRLSVGYKIEEALIDCQKIQQRKIYAN